MRVIANTSYVINNGKRLFCATVSINGWLEDKGGSQFCEIDFHNVQLTSKCVMLNEMFKDNWNLQKLNLEDWDMNNVKRIDGIFKNCSSLKEICTGNWSLDEVEKRRTQKQERAKKQGNEELERILSCIKENTLQLSTKKEMYSLITKGLHINIKMSASKPEMIVILEDNLLPDNIKVYNEHLPAFGLRQCDLKSFGIEPKSDWMKRCLSRMGSWGSMYQIYIYDITKAFGIAS